MSCATVSCSRRNAMGSCSKCLWQQCYAVLNSLQLCRFEPLQTFVPWTIDFVVLAHLVLKQRVQQPANSRKHGDGAMQLCRKPATSTSYKAWGIGANSCRKVSQSFRLTYEFHSCDLDAEALPALCFGRPQPVWLLPDREWFHENSTNFMTQRLLSTVSEADAIAIAARPCIGRDSIAWAFPCVSLASLLSVRM